MTTSPPRPFEGFPFDVARLFSAYLSEGKKWVRHVQNPEFRMAKLDWSRTRKFKEAEEKYAPGTKLKDGRVVREQAPRDSLAVRAAEAEKRWLKKLRRKDRESLR